MKKTENIMGYNVSSLDIHALSDSILKRLRGRIKTIVSTINPHSFVVAETDAEFKRALEQSNFLLADGIGIIIAAKLLKKNINRVTGPDYFSEIHRLLNQSDDKCVRRFRIFYLGGSKELLEKLLDKVSLNWPNVDVAGSFSPPFTDEFSEVETRSMIDAVNTSGADILWVAMTAPKQEKWVQKNANRINCILISSIGAAFDFHAGTVRRAPIPLRKVGLEWFYRFIFEPRRLWRRNLVSMPLFLKNLFKYLIGGK